jgi:thymidine kinase
MEKEILKKIEELKEAKKTNSVTVDEYCSIIHQLYQQLKNLKENKN